MNQSIELESGKCPESQKLQQDIPELCYVIVSEKDLFNIDNNGSYFKRVVVEGLSDSGYVPFSSLHVLAAASVVAEREGKTMPHYEG